ncbi:hypothetical protein IWQ60_009102 [Tieghemiomyces parasiticus]|uniref:Uncharacterized protein n=1 Tax=Tieghemiomyces parasiticus TaxID=78921 RepID=A0A9W7ZXI2_9FUNG|nr:hypothetical protein IWQ60_009102 [Tieghemiomyces parasiticus]
MVTVSIQGRLAITHGGPPPSADPVGNMMPSMTLAYYQALEIFVATPSVAYYDAERAVEDVLKRYNSAEAASTTVPYQLLAYYLNPTTNVMQGDVIFDFAKDPCDQMMNEVGRLKSPFAVLTLAVQARPQMPDDWWTFKDQEMGDMYDTLEF